jgi:hypothetical protein
MGALDDFSSARTGQGLTLTAASRVPASDWVLTFDFENCLPNSRHSTLGPMVSNTAAI